MNQMDVYEQIRKLGYELPPVPPLAGLYLPVKQVGSLLYVSGQGCTRGGKAVYAGKMGADQDLQGGQSAARLCILNALSVLHQYLSDLNRIKNVVKILGFVASAPGFGDQPMVMNGASQFLIEVFGEKGRHARSAIGANELPGDITVEIELIVEV
jgi:enamine deaminase RidA (YjgF/YER057c/UK114 family)